MIKFRAMTEPADWDWFLDRIPTMRGPDSQGIVAYDDRGIQAICVSERFTVDACNIHMAIDNPLVIRAGFLCEIASHLFETNSRNRVFGTIPSNNEKSLRLGRHVGFVEVARIADAYDKGVDSIIVRMDKEACRWLNREQRKEAA